MKNLKASVVLLTTAIALLPACGQRNQSVPGSASAPSRPSSGMASSASVAGTSGPSTFAILSASGEPVFTVKADGNNLKVLFTADGKQRTLEGKRHDSGKRKYAESGQMIAEVKPSDSGFKVRSADGKTLYWKVKRDSDKVKISDNEENQHPYVLKSKSDRIEVLDPSGKSLGSVRFDATKGAAVEDASGQVRFTAQGGGQKRYLGIALMNGIPAAMRAILIAELSTLDR